LNFLKNADKKVTFSLMDNFDKTLIDFRSETIKLFLDELYPNQKLHFLDPFLMGREDDTKVVKKLNDAINSSTLKLNDKDLVCSLYKNLLFEENFESIYFKDKSLINVLTTLSALKLKILHARSIMFSTLYRIETDFGTNRIVPIINVLNNVQKGGNIELEVYSSAYNDKNLIKAKAQNEISSKVINGKTNITIKANSEKVMQIKGTATILDEFGIPHIYPWSKTVYLN
jgi:hypothetical protein